MNIKVFWWECVGVEPTRRHAGAVSVLHVLKLSIVELTQC